MPSFFNTPDSTGSKSQIHLSFEERGTSLTVLILFICIRAHARVQ